MQRMVHQLCQLRVIHHFCLDFRHTLPRQFPPIYLFLASPCSARIDQSFPIPHGPSLQLFLHESFLSTCEGAQKHPSYCWVKADVKFTLVFATESSFCAAPATSFHTLQSEQRYVHRKRKSLSREQWLQRAQAGGKINGEERPSI